MSEPTERPVAPSKKLFPSLLETMHCASGSDNKGISVFVEANFSLSNTWKNQMYVRFQKKILKIVGHCQGHADFQESFEGKD